MYTPIGSELKNPLFALRSASPPPGLPGDGSGLEEDLISAPGAPPHADARASLTAALLPPLHRRIEKSRHITKHADLLLQQAMQEGHEDGTNTPELESWSLLVAFCLEHALWVTSVLDAHPGHPHPVDFLLNTRRHQALSMLLGTLDREQMRFNYFPLEHEFVRSKSVFKRMVTPPDYQGTSRKYVFIGATDTKGKMHDYCVCLYPHEVNPSDWNTFETWHCDYQHGSRQGLASFQSSTLSLTGTVTSDLRLLGASGIITTSAGPLTFRGSATLHVDPTRGVSAMSGRAELPDGTTFEGCLYGKESRGKACFADGATYEGSFYDEALVNSATASGHGTLSDGLGVYTGTLTLRQRTGHGTQTYKDGSVYSGAWHRDQYHGEGHWLQTDGTVFIGRFSEGRPAEPMQMVKTDGTEHIAYFIGQKYVSSPGTKTGADGKARNLKQISASSFTELENKVSAMSLRIQRLETELQKAAQPAVHSIVQTEPRPLPNEAA